MGCDLHVHTYVHCPVFIVWLLRTFTLTLFWQKFHESNTFTKEIIEIIDLTKYFLGESKFFVISHCAFETNK